MVDDGEITLIQNLDRELYYFKFEWLYDMEPIDSHVYHSFTGDKLKDFILWLSEDALNARNKDTKERWERIQKSIAENSKGL